MATFAMPLRTQPRNNAPMGGIERLRDETGEKIKEDFLSFLENYREGGSGLSSSVVVPTSEMLTGTTPISEPPQLTADLPIYRQQLFEMRQDGQNTLFIDFVHLFRFNDVLANAVADNYYRFEPFLRAALQAFVAAHVPSYGRISNTNQLREFWVAFYGLGIVHKLRELTTQKIGQLISVSGTVTRTSEVRPELFLGTFKCVDCGFVVRNVEQQFKYTEPTICGNPLCQNRRQWTLITEQSTFVNWQRVRVQESASEIPAGSMPSLDVIVRNDLVERAKAGDKCIFSGNLIVVPDVSQLALPGSKLQASIDGGRPHNQSNEGVSGTRELGVRELTYKLGFLACMSQPSYVNSGVVNIRTDEEVIDEEQDPRTIFTPEELEEIARIKNAPQIYRRLVESMTPAIFGHSEIKAGILLMLFGGVHKVTPEGIHLRGDINVCIVGDPGTAKSQFLRYVMGFLPRSVYTSGKSSSAAGLTASVLKDEETGEFTIEAGALMLADNGICAIDEFDKMDIGDQVAIHEAMEQQTISIAKAGIQATLNARTSILAAANPIGGRYDRKRTLRQNVAMSAPIMSRFDLFFVILDECNEVADYNIARHILGIHRYRDEALEPEFSTEQLQRYIKFGRTIKPKITREAASLLVTKYRQLRQNDCTGSGSSYRMTVRQLESMIRLSEALARLHCDLEVKVGYVEEAARLLKSSIIRVETDNVDLGVDDLALATAADAIEAGHADESNSLPRPTEPRLQLKYEDYVRISNMLVYQLRRRENEVAAAAAVASEGEAEGSDEPAGLTRTELLDWYLEQIESELETEEDFHARRREAKAVIGRLLHHDGVLIALKSGMVREGATGDEQNEAEENHDVLVVHPNYVLQ